MKSWKIFAPLLVLFSIAATCLAQDGTPTSALAGSYQIRNKKFGALLRPENANGAVGTPLVLYPAEPWKCMTWRFQSAGDSGFQLQNHFTSKTFAAEAASAQSDPAVTQVLFSKQPSERPTWEFVKLTDGSYKITDKKTGKALTAIDGKGGIRIFVQPWEGKAEQKWELLPIDPKQLTM